MKNIILKSSIIAVLLNIFLSLLLSPFATKDEIKPPNGAANLSFKSQVMHMLVHHKQVLLVSSLIIFVLTMISVYLATLK
tara:strand:+ start:1308 stop:1547 length:240 start_codon:yes stop_codon:yes gene_type:complete